ncbi:MAG: FAD-dependent oxidoreductase [Lachnospiraceae bacterium]
MLIKIDGKEIQVKENETILNAALNAGIYIPHLCSHPNLEAKGGCKLCSVEIEGVEEAVCACMVKAEEGMNIRIYGEKADLIRKTSMELILATHPADCTGCPKYGSCELQSMYQYLGVSAERWRKKSRTVENDSSNPLIQHLFTRCIRCGRCIRACRDLRGVEVLDYINTKEGVHAGIPEGKSLKEAGCKFCGACIEVCPTGAIMDAREAGEEEVNYLEAVVPCSTNCPANIDIPRFVRYIKQEEFEKATAVIREKVPFPEILGSICDHACEKACKRNAFENPISICKLKKAASVYSDDAWKKNRMQNPATGKKVAIVGAGPAGLTAAYYLRLKGHDVTVFEEKEVAGGQCRYGIPEYRLPRDTIQREVDDILEVGVVLNTGRKIESVKELQEQGYESILLATGTHEGVKLNIPGSELENVYLNTKFLESVRSDKPLPVGERVIILGGGNVAYDCARTAIRLGAKEVHIACLESLEKMTASIEERVEGEQEGIILHDGTSFLRIIGEKQVEGIELQKVEKFYFDEERKAVLELKEGSEEVISVDTVIFAVGQKPKEVDGFGVELLRNAYIKVNQNAETSLSGVFACGDVVTGTKSVISAIAEGRKSAQEIDRYLGGNGNITEILIEKEPVETCIGRTKDFTELKRQCPELIDAHIRKDCFVEIEKTFDKELAKYEASRCLQCDLRLTLEKPKLWNEYSEETQ